MKTHIIISLFIFLALPCFCFGQSHHKVLINKMEEYEEDIQNTYSEYQKVYYERKSSKSELLAFEEIISVYVSQILEIYETLTLSSIKMMEKPRDIAARSLIFRALTYLEKAPLNVEFYEKACYDYYRALDMYNESEKVPVILKSLPKPIRVANIEYKRLIDLIEAKGKELFSFGKVQIVLKSFKITSNLNAESFEFIRFSSPARTRKYTYDEAETRIKSAFNEILINNNSNNFFLALPEGSYFIRSRTIDNPLFPYLSAIYVRANQQQEYVIEPLVDWIIMYENPTTKQPDFYKAGDSYSGNGHGNSNGGSSFFLSRNKDEDDAANLSVIDDALTSAMENVDINKIFNLRDPWIRSRFANVASQTISIHISSPHYFNTWSKWWDAWEISKNITDKFSPGNPVPTELIQLVYLVLQKF
ncbi:hypothetical protein GF337_16150 [candidate division KSB1 bacterium]|nr:hypothetical protein [candidate division KSB1 bacterium]